MNKRSTLHASLVIYWLMLIIYFFSDAISLDGRITIFEILYHNCSDDIVSCLQFFSPIVVLVFGVLVAISNNEQIRGIWLYYTTIGTIMMSGGLLYDLIDLGYDAWYDWTTEVQHIATMVFPLVSLILCLHIRSVYKYGDDI